MSAGRRSQITTALRAMVRELDVASVSAAEAVALIDWFAEIERLGAAGKAFAAAAASAREVWIAEGERGPADWLAKRTSSTVSAARTVIDTAERVERAPTTAAALRAGELNLDQAAAVSAGAVADPSKERELLAIARGASLQELRDSSARVRAAADPDHSARYERIRRGRFWRRWTDAEGARCGSYKLTPDAAALVEAAAQPFIDAAIDEARRIGSREPFEAHAADGFVAMARCAQAGSSEAGEHADGAQAARGGRGRRRLRNRRELIGLVDLAALRRGELETGETCEIAGVGPVPVDVARSVFGDALLRIVIRDGVDIRTVVHTGRTANAVQETAVLVRDGGRCVRPRCAVPISEIDHINAFAATRRTTLDDLAGLCAHDHDLKSHFGHTYERAEDGTVRWTRPDGIVEEARPPP